MSSADVAPIMPATAAAVAVPAAPSAAKEVGLVKSTSLYVGDLVPDASEPVLFEVRAAARPVLLQTRPLCLA